MIRVGLWLLDRAVNTLPLSWLLAAATVLGALVARLPTKRRRIVQTNLQLTGLVSDPQRVAAAARSNLVSTLRGYAEHLVAWRRRKLPQVPVTISGADLLADDGRGVLLLFAHQHPLELCARLLVAHVGRPLVQVARAQDARWLQQYVDQGRRAHVGPTLDKKDLRGVLRTLRDGAMVGYLADQNFRHDSITVPFFGHPASALALWPRLLKRAGARAVVASVRRDGAGYAIALEALELPPAASERAWAEAYLAAVERAVRASPLQYLWAHRRFKTQPGGAEGAVYRSASS